MAPLTVLIGRLPSSSILSGELLSWMTYSKPPIFCVPTGAMVYIRDVASVRDGNPPQTNIVHVDGNRSVLMMVLKAGSISTLDIIAGIKQKVIEVKDALPDPLKI